MKLFSNKKKLIVIGSGILIGFIAGFAYWKFIGCQSGTCPITSQWHTTSLYGGVMGYLLADSIRIGKKKQSQEEEMEKSES